MSHSTMKYEEIIEKIDEVETCLYQLVGEIDYGNITNIDTYWASLTESLEKLADKIGYKNRRESVSYTHEALGAFVGIIKGDLREMAETMENYFEGGGSSDSVDYDDIEEYQSLALDFEKSFLEFTSAIREKYENE